MFTNNIEMILTMITGVTEFVVLVLISRALLNFLKPPRTILERSGGRFVFNIWQESRQASNVPNVTCSLPITTQKRSQQRLW